jgi:predicted nuclease of predicted toxin-antitoxin system
LFDENLSHRLAKRVAIAFPGSVHVRDLGLRGAPDATLWSRAGGESLMIVTKDDDFRQLSFLRGAPPKVVWLVVGNAGTERIAELLEHRRQAIEAFAANADEALLLLRLPASGSP